MYFRLGPHSAITQQLLVLLVCVIACCSGCFIRNCPLGGKRSLSDVRGVQPSRECLRCGPDMMGRCLGPIICCGPMGCFMGTEETRVCQKENDIPTPCSVGGDSCGGDSQGKCVADGLCCSDGGCDLDSQCEMSQIYEPSPRSSSGNTQSFNPELLTYIRQLMTKRAYGKRR